MRIFIIIVFTVCWFKSSGQFAKLVNVNPSPRQGEELEITIVLDKQNLEQLKIDLRRQGKTSDSLQKNNYALGTLKIQNVPADTGLFSFGPFTFIIDGQTYQTEKWAVQVDKKLPDHIRDGLWVRFRRHEEKNYIIIEQRIPNIKEFKNGMAPIDINEGVTFARLDFQKLKQEGIEILSNTPTTSVHFLESGNKYKDIFSDLVSYKRTVYRFEFQKRTTVSITKDFFIDLPLTAAFEGAVVKN